MAFHCASLTPSTTNWAKPPVVVGHAEGRVLRVEQFAGRGDDRLEDVAHFEVPAHGQQRGAHRVQARPGSLAHAPNVPAGGDPAYRTGDGADLGRWA